MTFTVTDFFRRFPTDDACLDHLMQVRYGDHADCPKCGKEDALYRLKKLPAYACSRCGHHVHPMVGTPFERSRTPLQKWFYALYLFTTTRHGVAAKELQRQLGVTYKTAWRMGHEIRKYMGRVDGDGTLSGHVELDEAFIGGRIKGRKKDGITGRGAKKIVVFGMVERGGEIIARVVKTAGRKDLFPLISNYVAPGTRISTDEWPAYKTLPALGYTHKTVRHGAKEYARGNTHVNTLEGFWAILKRSIRGTHIHVSRKHLQKYLVEFEFRFNRRETPHRMLHDLLASF